MKVLSEEKESFSPFGFVIIQRFIPVITNDGNGGVGGGSTAAQRIVAFTFCHCALLHLVQQNEW